MSRFSKNGTAAVAALAASATFALAGVANAGGPTIVDVEEDIVVSTTWTADNVYNLTRQIYVLPGATLTIEPGTVIASETSDNGAGSLAITRGARIFANGTADMPIIMTSSEDDFSTWREAANEWGNLTIMGRGYISNSFVEGNSASCGNNVSPMEGLIPDFVGDPNTLYGGTDDDDDSGCISYLSLRYGGRVVGLANELNGMSLGGIGRETDIQCVEIMNNVDDGIEIWGGTVNLKYFSIWNIGDDSLDIDQGWRGKAQFGLIVQGYSLDADQGSGVGDNCIEMDGAEDSFAQPVTTGAIYNVTVIGQPANGAGDGLTAWRDNARMQFRNSIFMDGGERVVRFDNLDGDGSQGYGAGGTLSWADTWTTAFDQYSTVNGCDDPELLYTAQVDGNLIEMTDSVFFNNARADAYDEANARGVFAASNNNVFEPKGSPIAQIVRAAPVIRGGKVMQRVITLDPRATNDAATSAGSAPDDGFFTPANYRGAFAADGNWLCGWSASSQFGFLVEDGDCFAPMSPCGDVEVIEGDLNGDGIVNGADLAILLGNWGGSGIGDLDMNGNVDGADLATLLGAWTA